MFDLLSVPRELGWPLAIALAWLAGEFAHRIDVPRITAYAVIGFVCSPAQLGLLPAGDGTIGPLLANVGFGLILFEFGYRTNLHWFRNNPALAATAVAESLLTLACVYLACRALGTAALSSLLLASVAIATSPATLTRVVNEQRSSGQVTERALHLAAFNCVIAVFVFKVVVGFWTFDTSGDLVRAISGSGLMLIISAGAGTLVGVTIPVVLRITSKHVSDGTMAFAIAVVLLVTITHTLKFSPIVACLAFGLVARHRRVALNQAQRNFGTLGDFLVIFLFVHVAATVDWRRALAGLGVGVVLVLVRSATKLATVTALARVSGTSLRKGMLTAVALTPLSTIGILMLEDTRYVGVDLVDTLAPLAAATLLLEFVAPIAIQLALRAAGEAHQEDVQGGR